MGNKMEYLIGLDIGTSSVKGILMTTEGVTVHTAKEVFIYRELPNGGVEIDAEDYLSACYKALKTLAGAANGETIKGVCASSASGNLLLLGKDGKPLTPIINWQDKRVTDEAKDVLGDMDDEAFYRQIGWPFRYKTFPLAHLCYIKKHNPKLLEECGMVCMSTEYLYYMLTGKWGISTSAGTTFYLIDQQKGTYIPELLDIFGLEETQLPPVMSCGQVLGMVTEEVEAACGVPAGTPVVLGSFDHPSAARGVGVLKEGEVLLSCGTSWVSFFPLADREKGLNANMLLDPFLSPTGCYAGMSSIASLSGRLQLYVHRYIDASKEAFQKLSEYAKASERGAGGLSINPLEEPNDHTVLAYPKEHIARAIMEGTVELLRNRLEALAAKGVIAKTAVMVGGPSEDPFWITLIEEMCGISVKVMHGSFAGAVGAAVIAGVGVGVYQDEEAFTQLNSAKGEKTDV